MLASCQGIQGYFSHMISWAFQYVPGCVTCIDLYPSNRQTFSSFISLAPTSESRTEGLSPVERSGSHALTDSRGKCTVPKHPPAHSLQSPTYLMNFFCIFFFKF